MLCQEVMKSNVKAVAPQDSAEYAARRMRDEKIGFLPVCDDQGKVVGTLTDRDIAVRLVAESQALDTPVSTIMTRDVIACRPTDDIARVGELMRSAKVSRVMCTDEAGHIKGVISLSDLAQVVKGGPALQTVRQVTDRESRLDVH